MTTAPLFTLRQAKAEDSAIAFEWRNDPDGRAASWSAAPVEWSGHARGWAESLNAEDRDLLIVEADTASLWATWRTAATLRRCRDSRPHSGYYCSRTEQRGDFSH